jgi:polyferredoxin
MLLFPLIMNYFSPYIIIDGASQGILNASPIIFGMMFFSALFLGRSWCGWACPAAGFGEICQAVNDKPVNGKKIDWIKWAIWIPWMGIIAWAAISAGGYQRVDFFHLIDNGISVNRPEAYFIYYIVVGLFVGLAIIVGRRAGCHTICWMAPFMILGRKLRNLGGWPSLRLVANASECRNCKRCTTNCPMSLDVNGMVKIQNMEHTECVLCGTCVDNCPEKAIHYVFNATPRKS